MSCFQLTGIVFNFYNGQGTVSPLRDGIEFSWGSTLISGFGTACRGDVSHGSSTRNTASHPIRMKARTPRPTLRPAKWFSSTSDNYRIFRSPAPTTFLHPPTPFLYICVSCAHILSNLKARLTLRLGLNNM